MQKYKGLIFDLDGTLTLTQHFHFLAYQKVFKDLGINYTKEIDYRYAGQGSERIFPQVFAENGKKITPEEIEKYYAEKKAIYKRLLEENELEPVQGIQKFLKRMQEMGLKMAVASGNRLESIEFILRKLGLFSYFSAIVTNKDVRNPKPAPDVFLAAAEKLGLKPEECIVFEDAVSGVTAAKAAGIECIALLTGTDKQKLLDAGADAVALNYDEIPIPCFLEENPEC